MGRRYGNESALLGMLERMTPSLSGGVIEAPLGRVDQVLRGWLGDHGEIEWSSKGLVKRRMNARITHQSQTDSGMRSSGGEVLFLLVQKPRLEWNKA